MPLDVPASGSSALSTQEHRRSVARLTPYLLPVPFFVAYSVLSAARFNRLATKSWDLGIFEQAIRSYANLRPPIVDIKGPGFNLLGDHFSPLLAVLAPFYKIWPSPMTLLVAQAAALALSILPVTRLATATLGLARGTALGTAYGLSWGVQNAADSDFHEVALAVPLIAFALEGVMQRRVWAVVAPSMLLVLVKEDLGLTTTAVIGLLLARYRRRAGAALSIFGLTASLLTVTVVMPLINPNGYDYWSKWAGGQANLTIGSLLSLPLHVFSPTIKLLTLSMFVAAAGLIGLRSPIILVALPTLAWRMLSREAGYWGPGWHYSAVLMPIATVALVDAICRSRRSGRQWIRGYGEAVVPAVLAGSVVLAVTQLPSRDLAERATYAASPREPEARRLLALIPNGASVETDIGLMAHLTSRTRVFWVGGAPDEKPDYIVIDGQAGWSAPIDDPVALATELHPTLRYVLIFDEADYFVLRRST
jgi:uncharacterized membrane protein